jgi:hypothetical protein
MTCQTLRSIRPGALKLGSRECEWYPIRHDVRTHAVCSAPVEQVAGCDWCPACTVFVPDAGVRMSPCDGHKKAIR